MTTTNQKTAPVIHRIYGTVRAIPDNVEETRIIPVILSSPKKDRHGTVLNIEGWDIENYNNNPVVGYQHELYGNWMTEETDPDRVIGKDTGITFETDNLLTKVMVGHPEFEPQEMNGLAEKVFRKLVFGSLRSASVGFNSIGTGHWDTDSTGDETFYYEGQELLEYSIVNIPSNPDAVARSMRDQARGVLNYAFQILGDQFTRSRLENMPVKEVLTLLEGRDVGIKHTDPQKVANQLSELEQLRNKIDELERLNQFYRRKAGLKMASK